MNKYIWIKLILNFTLFLFSYEIFEYNIESDKNKIISEFIVRLRHHFKGRIDFSKKEQIAIQQKRS